MATRAVRVAALALFVVGLVAPAARAGAADPPWYGWTGAVGGTSRSARYDAGQWIYTNTLDQGRGANTDHIDRRDLFGAVDLLDHDLYGLTTYDLFGVHRAAHNGDYLLPTDHAKWPDFTGELSEVRLAVQGGNLWVRFTFPSMPAADRQIATLTFASSGAQLPATSWPAGAGVRSRWQVALTAWGTGASLARTGTLLGVPTTTSTSQPLGAAGGAVRVADHAIETRVPLSALPPGPWTLSGGSGLATPGAPGAYWPVLPVPSTPITPGAFGLPGPAVWSLLFADDDPWSFDEHRQADLLAGRDVSSATAAVDPTRLASGATVAPPVRLGAQTRLFTSALDRGDGIRRGELDFVGVTPPVELPIGTPLGEPLRAFEYRGRLQPYSLQVPSSYAASTEARPLIVYLHGLNGTPEEPFGPVVGLAAEADRRGYLLAGALGRGDLWYEGDGEADVLEVIADVQAHYRVDPDRIYLMGHSMGSAGTYHVALRNPDLFAAVAPAEGVDSAGLWRNGRDLGWLHLGADIDADAGSEQGRAFYTARASAGWQSTLLDYHSKTHEYSVVYDTLPRLFAFFESHRRDPAPPAVSYTAVAGDAGPGLDHAGAYWVGGLTAADPGRDVSVEAESFGRAHALPDPDVAVRTEQEVDEGGTSGKDTRATLYDTAAVPGPLRPAENRAAVRLANASAVSLDLAAMVLRTDAPLVLEVTTDAPVAIRLLGGAPLAAGPTPAGTSVQRSGSDVVVHLPPGTHTLTLHP